MTSELVLAALNMALELRKPEGVIHHSDQGSQYTSIAFGNRCKEMASGPRWASSATPTTTPWPRLPSKQAGYMRADHFPSSSRACKRRRVHTCTKSTTTPYRGQFGVRTSETTSVAAPPLIDASGFSAAPLTTASPCCLAPLASWETWAQPGAHTSVAGRSATGTTAVSRSLISRTGNAMALMGGLLIWNQSASP